MAETVCSACSVDTSDGGFRLASIARETRTVGWLSDPRIVVGRMALAAVSRAGLGRPERRYERRGDRGLSRLHSRIDRDHDVRLQWQARQPPARDVAAYVDQYVPARGQHVLPRASDWRGERLDRHRDVGRVAGNRDERASVTEPGCRASKCSKCPVTKRAWPMARSCGCVSRST